MDVSVDRRLKLLSSYQAPLIVVGTHRSGTSLLVKILKKNGFYFGSDIRGHEESQYFLRLNEFLLGNFGASWSDPIHFIEHIQKSGPVPFRKKADQSLTTRDRFMNWSSLLKVVFGYYNGWGWKDPRNSITLPYLLQFFPNAKVLHICRNGLDVALSINSREARREKSSYLYSPHLLDFKNCFNLWKLYEKTILEYSLQLSVTKYLRIKYEDLLNQDEVTRLELGRFLGCAIKLDYPWVLPSNSNKFGGPLRQTYYECMNDPFLREFGYE